MKACPHCRRFVRLRRDGTTVGHAPCRFAGLDPIDIDASPGGARAGAGRKRAPRATGAEVVAALDALLPRGSTVHATRCQVPVERVYEAKPRGCSVATLTEWCRLCADRSEVVSDGL